MGEGPAMSPVLSVTSGLSPGHPEWADGGVEAGVPVSLPFAQHPELMLVSKPCILLGKIRPYWLAGGKLISHSWEMEFDKEAGRGFTSVLLCLLAV